MKNIIVSEKMDVIECSFYHFCTKIKCHDLDLNMLNMRVLPKSYCYSLDTWKFQLGTQCLRIQNTSFSFDPYDWFSLFANLHVCDEYVKQIYFFFAVNEILTLYPMSSAILHKLVFNPLSWFMIVYNLLTLCYMSW